MKLKKLFLLSSMIVSLTASSSFALTTTTEKKIKLFNEKNQSLFIKDNDITGLNCQIAPNYLALKDYKNAIKYYSMALNMMEKSNDKKGMAVILANLSLAQILNGSVSDAEKTINKSLKINPNHPEALSILPLILEAKGKKQEAIDLTKKNCSKKDELSCNYLNNKKKLSLIDFFKIYNDSRTEKQWSKK